MKLAGRDLYFQLIPHRRLALRIKYHKAQDPPMGEVSLSLGVFTMEFNDAGPNGSWQEISKHKLESHQWVLSMITDFTQSNCFKGGLKISFDKKGRQLAMSRMEYALCARQRALPDAESKGGIHVRGQFKETLHTFH
jgi:hypothetical protein